MGKAVLPPSTSLHTKCLAVGKAEPGLQSPRSWALTHSDHVTLRESLPLSGAQSPYSEVGCTRVEFLTFSPSEGPLGADFQALFGEFDLLGVGCGTWDLNLNKCSE